VVSSHRVINALALWGTNHDSNRTFKVAVFPPVFVADYGDSFANQKVVGTAVLTGDNALFL
jgi:hypothetical protein